MHIILRAFGDTEWQHLLSFWWNLSAIAINFTWNFESWIRKTYAHSNVICRSLQYFCAIFGWVALMFFLSKHKISSMSILGQWFLKVTLLHIVLAWQHISKNIFLYLRRFFLERAFVSTKLKTGPSDSTTFLEIGGIMY